MRLGATHAGRSHQQNPFTHTRATKLERKKVNRILAALCALSRDKLSWWMICLFLFCNMYTWCAGCLCRWIWAGCEKVAKRRWAQKRAKGISFEKTATLWLCYYLQEERDAALLPQQINLPLIFIIYQRGELLQSFSNARERWINSFYERRCYSEPFSFSDYYDSFSSLGIVGSAAAPPKFYLSRRRCRCEWECCRMGSLSLYCVLLYLRVIYDRKHRQPI